MGNAARPLPPPSPTVICQPDVASRRVELVQCGVANADEEMAAIGGGPGNHGIIRLRVPAHFSSLRVQGIERRLIVAVGANVHGIACQQRIAVEAVRRGELPGNLAGGLI